MRKRKNEGIEPIASADWVPLYYSYLRRLVRDLPVTEDSTSFSVEQMLTIEKAELGIRLDNVRVYGLDEMDYLTNLILERVAKYEADRESKSVSDGASTV